jgi:hypothetical protein
LDEKRGRFVRMKREERKAEVSEGARAWLAILAKLCRPKGKPEKHE